MGCRSDQAVRWNWDMVSSQLPAEEMFQEKLRCCNLCDSGAGVEGGGGEGERWLGLVTGRRAAEWVARVAGCVQGCQGCVFSC